MRSTHTLPSKYPGSPRHSRYRSPKAFPAKTPFRPLLPPPNRSWQAILPANALGKPLDSLLQPQCRNATTVCRQPASQRCVAVIDTTSRSNRESLRSITQFLGPGGHLITAHFSIYKLPDYKITNSYRSISPSTISMDPIAATTSAISLPSHIFGRVCRFAKQAARICTRYGFAVPSLTM